MDNKPIPKTDGCFLLLHRVPDRMAENVPLNERQIIIHSSVIDWCRCFGGGRGTTVGFEKSMLPYPDNDMIIVEETVAQIYDMISKGGSV